MHAVSAEEKSDAATKIQPALNFNEFFYRIASQTHLYGSEYVDALHGHIYYTLTHTYITYTKIDGYLIAHMCIFHVQLNGNCRMYESMSRIFFLNFKLPLVVLIRVIQKVPARKKNT